MKLNRPLLGWTMLTALGSAAAAAGDAPVLRGNQVTESALIDALGVEQPPPDPVTRGFKPSIAADPGAAASPAIAARQDSAAGAGTAARTGAYAATPRKPAAPGSANLLIAFHTASATLTADSKAVLDTVAKALQSDALAGLTFRVEGHADARGDSEANMKLSQARAEAVVAYLVGRHGILPRTPDRAGQGRCRADEQGAGRCAGEPPGHDRHQPRLRWRYRHRAGAHATRAGRRPAGPAPARRRGGPIAAWRRRRRRHLRRRNRGRPHRRRTATHARLLRQAPADRSGRRLSPPSQACWPSSGTSGGRTRRAASPARHRRRSPC